MADGGPSAPQLPYIIPPVVSLFLLFSPNASCTTCSLIHTSCSTSSTRSYATINWSFFKPEFAGKPDEDAEAHLLGTNDWMDTHSFPEGVKVQRFCLTFVGEDRLCYESLRLIDLDWNGLQNHFRQQYSKLGNTREQLFHA